MTRKGINRFFFTLISIIILFFIIDYFSSTQNAKIKIKEIKKEIKGEIIDKYSVRDTPPTHLRINTSKGIISISPNQYLVKYANIGDSIYKMENSNIAIILKPNGKQEKFYYTKISTKTIKKHNLPQEWKF